MPNKDWRFTTLGEFVTLQRGHDLPGKDRKPGAVPILGSFGITGYHDKAKAPGPGVTVGRSGASFGTVSYSPCPYWPLNTALYVNDFHGNDERFAYYFLQCLDLKRFNSGSAQPSLNRNFIHPLEVAIPPLREQRAIAAILGAIDDKIELNRKMSATLEAMARAIFTSWFVDFDPVRAKAEGRDTGLAPEIATLFPDAFVAYADGEIPTNWSMHGLDDVATFLNGLALQRFPPRDGSPTLPVIKIAQLRAGHVKNADRADSSLKSDYVVTNGDILFSWSGSLECEIWVGGSGALNQHLFKVTGTVVPNWFAYLSVLHHLPSFRQIAAAKATTMGHIQRHHLHEATICIPSKPVFDAASALIGPMIEASWKRRLQSNTIATLRDTLLPKLISGEFRVSDAERILEMSA